MKPTVIIDDREWKRAARELVEHSSRSCVDFTNGQAYRVVTLAIKHTEKANRRKIETLLKSSSFYDELRIGSEGKRKWVRANRDATADRKSIAAQMLFKYYWTHGKRWPVRPIVMKTTALQGLIHRLLAVKSKSVGMMKAGWITAANTLRRAVYEIPPGVSNRKGFGNVSAKLGGWARPARLSGIFRKIEAIAANEAPGYQIGKRKERAWLGPLGNPMNVLARGLNKAFSIAAADMIKHLERKLQRDFDRFNKKAP